MPYRTPEDLPERVARLGFAALVLAVLVVPLGVSNQRSERADLTRQLERDAVAAASLAVDLLRPGASSADRRAIRERLGEYAERSDARVVVVDAAAGLAPEP